jgi:hypothetical protein
MSAGEAADTWHVVRLRLIFAIALLAVVACAAAGISSALGAHAKLPARSHPARCVKTVGLQSHGIYVLHRVSVRCRRRGARHVTRAHGKRAHSRRRGRSAPHRPTRHSGSPRR